MSPGVAVLEVLVRPQFLVGTDLGIFFVAKLGPSAIATVGLTESYLFLLYSIAVGLAMAVTATIARRIGEGNREAAAVQAIWIALLASVPFAVAGVIWARDLLALMGADPRVLEHGYRYMQWMLGANVVIMLLFVINAIFRGAGDAAIATVIGRGTGVLHQLWVLFRGGEHIRVLPSQLRWDGRVLGNMVRTSLGGVGQAGPRCRHAPPDPERPPLLPCVH